MFKILLISERKSGIRYWLNWQSVATKKYSPDNSHYKYAEKFVLINRACELKGEFNMDCQWYAYRTIVRIIWVVQINEDQIILATLSCWLPVS